MREQSKGTCLFCKNVFAENVMTEHLGACPQRKSGSETRFHIRVKGLDLPQYWLHISGHPKARLSHLDEFLRDIWLECCGHLSSFEIKEKEYLGAGMEVSGAENMAVPLGRVLIPGLQFTHIYDFGTPTELRLRVIGEIQCAPDRKKISLLARNVAPSFACVKCGKPARQLCSQCGWEGDAWLCDKCGHEHECGEEALLPVVNSPRIGQCGYTGES